MANDMQPKGKNKALTVIIIAIIAILIIVLAVLALTQKEETNTPDGERNTPANETGDVDSQGEANTNTDEPMAGDGTGAAGEEMPEALVNAEAQVEGGNLVTEDNKVITQEGEEAKNDVEPGSPEAPQQTGPIDEEALPENTVKVGVSAEGFSPAEVRMPANSAVTMSVTSTDDYTHIFKFKDDALSAVAVGIAPGETRAITFQTPGPGEYAFYCDVPGHENRGEVGVMIVE
jgi:plastocyanin